MFSTSKQANVLMKDVIDKEHRQVDSVLDVFKK